MSAVRRSARRAAAPVAALLTAATLGIATPAHAAALGADAQCDSSGNGHFVCAATASGGTAPYTYAWSPISNAVIRSGATGRVAIGLCAVNRQSVLSLTVTDATGASVNTTGALDCTAIAP